MTLYKELKDLSHFKHEALGLGLRLGTAEELEDLVSATTFNSGVIAEIIMAYMLGYFKHVVGGVCGIYISMTADLDEKGVDFLLTRFGYDYKIQMKWNKLNDRAYDSDIIVVELGACYEFREKRYLPKLSGENAVIKLLEDSGVYDIEELLDIFDVHPELTKVLRAAWSILKH